MSGGGLHENNTRSSSEDFRTVVETLLKLLCLTVIGLFLANPKMQFIPRATFKLLSKLVFALFLPCLIFSELGQSITLKKFVDWWFIPVNVLVSTALGCILGCIVVAICRPPPQFKRFTIIMTGFGNTGNLLLAVVGSVCHTENTPFGEDCNSRGISSSNIPDFDITAESNGNSTMSLRCLAEPRVVRKIRIVAKQTPIKHILQPPTIASLLAIIIGTVPQLKTFFFGNDAPMSFITDSFEILAGAMVPCVMLILGGMLAEGPNESTLGLRTTIGIIVARLVVLPLIGIGVVALADKLNFLVENDGMFKFVLLLQYTTPSAILLGAIASLRGYAVSEASAVLFWQHVFALLSLSVYIIIYFRIIV
ncbi:Membrane transport protein [Sesbania bispinosa]|nr:Membrane transport protein [Sesbania bispinosa]